jgi:isopenicillin-N N-acyltransferase-like protein
VTLPIVHLTGTAYEQGVQHGQALKDRIAHNLEVYFARFERETGLARPEVLDRARRYAKAIEGQNGDYFDGMRGVADGSGFAPDDIAALQVRYEILYYQFGKNAQSEDVDGCTAFAVLPEVSANGHLLVGQNWDWIPQVQGAVLHTTDPDGMETLAFTEAGIVGGKIGLSSAGIGLAINGMTSTDDDWSTLAKPFHVRCYEILRARDFDAAVAVVTGEERACSTNFLIAQTPDKVVDIEAAPDKLRLLGCEGGCLVHTNNFTDPAEIGVAEPPNPKRSFSVGRRSRLGELLGAREKIAVEDIEADLRDHVRYPYGICRHAAEGLEPPEHHYITVTSVIMDLDAKTLRLTDGVPCENEYQTVTLA